MFLKIKKIRFHLALTLMVLMLLQAQVGFAAPRVRIDLERETRKKVTVAITEFVLKGSNADVIGIGKEAKKILERDLMLSEWFSPLPRQVFEELEKMESTTSKVDYRSWHQVGAQWLIKVEYSVTGGGKGQAFTFRLYDAVNKRFLLGKRYKASHDLLRKTVHRFADEVVMQLTGKRGLAETQIAFLNQENSGKEIYLIDFDGYNLRRLTNDHTVNLNPAWSPDGKWLIYTSYAARNPDLIMIDTAGDRRQTLHRLPGLNTAAVWSPDMKKIALVLSRDQNSEVYTLDEKRRLKRLTRHFNIDTSPTWSPDGKQIAFTSDRSGTAAPQIYIMDANEGDQSKVKRISFGSSYNDNPAWSPNGDQIAYTSRVGRQFKIKIYDFNTQKSHVVTTAPGSCEQPSWSPDGRFLIYRKKENNRHNLFIQRVGSEETRQLTFSGRGNSPAWSSYFKH
jgi:TolB protein